MYLNVPTHTQRKLGVQLIVHVKNNSDKVFWTLFYHYSTIFFIFFFTNSLYYRQETIIIIHNNFFDGTKSLKFFLYTENGVTILTAVVMIKVNIFRHNFQLCILHKELTKFLLSFTHMKISKIWIWNLNLRIVFLGHYEVLARVLFSIFLRIKFR